ncbi:hypothetical protein PIB30_083176 [Stylosanthes scabra]|uniref:Uncharacterized protein n=1 Tax=Stylosanthes scabra TaxID=79078 RepID=A0ABU6XUH8_9FABA|nr:hypothetical protein [Stylosanthes scabra]
MPFEVYETLDLDPLKTSREVFTTEDASVVSVVGITENVLVRIGQLTIPAEFHVIMPAKGDKGGETSDFVRKAISENNGIQAHLLEEIFTFSVGNVIEIFLLTPPPKPPRKGMHQMKVDNAEVQEEDPERKPKRRVRDITKGRIGNEKGSRNPPPQSNGKKKKIPLNPEKKKKKKKKELDEGGTEKKKRTLKCLSFRRNKSMDAHLVKNNSKWK